MQSFVGDRASSIKTLLLWWTDCQIKKKLWITFLNFPLILFSRNIPKIRKLNLKRCNILLVIGHTASRHLLLWWTDCQIKKKLWITFFEISANFFSKNIPKIRKFKMERCRVLLVIGQAASRHLLLWKAAC